MDDLSFLNNINSEQVESLYQNYLKDKSSVDSSWRTFFQGFELGVKNYESKPVSSNQTLIGKEFNVFDLIQAYRQRGHYFTLTNPVRKRRQYKPDLSIENFGLEEKDLETIFTAANEIGIGEAKLKDIIAFLEKTYCTSIGVEFMYIRLPNIVEWLLGKMEKTQNTPSFSKDEKIKLLKILSKTVLFEKFLGRRFPSQKRFSLEGAENFVPAVYTLINHASELGVEKFVFGMAHRGRLNMLANIFNKAVKDIFSEFEGKAYEDFNLLGDVKYHLGIKSKIKLDNDKNVELILTPNPSHLEAVGPVVQGISRSFIDNILDGDSSKLIPIIIHGDASVAGQGVVYEQIQMSEIKSFAVGGSIHIVINNQIGFTTDYIDARSSIYCTDVAKVIQSPIFHVNGDDIEAVAYVVKLAVDYRQKFKKDVFIDLLCYRRHGHNESDEPRFTQPILYKVIEKHPNPLTIYTENLIVQNIVSQDDVNQIENEYNVLLEECLIKSKEDPSIQIVPFMSDFWSEIPQTLSPESSFENVETRIDIDVLTEIGIKINTIPPGINVYRKLHKLLDARKEMLDNDNIDWALAEQLALGSLLNEGFNVRFSGQDVERGTFSHRHAVLNIEDSEEKFYPLRNIRKSQARFEIYNSLLSEYAVLGFEYGYALSSPNDLIIWEAQFGDFFNGAQIIIDQFISSAEEKWNAQNNLIMLLPHGYEGQGPEHSSAKIERFLSLCANYNLDIVQCTTPANYFHSLRRHLKRKFRKPLISFTPKSLLRHPECISSIEDFTENDFQLFIEEKNIVKEEIKTLVFCSGKIYFDISTERNQRKVSEMTFVRVEQLFPFSDKILDEIIKSYPNTDKLIWIQDEPANMGAWPFLSKILKPKGFTIIARPVSSSPATGSIVLHKQRLSKLIDKLFGNCVCDRNHSECKMICMNSINEQFYN